MLTIKQSRLLDYLTKALKNNKVSPSFEEMRINLGLSSKSGVHRLISSLEERGFIKRLHNKARAIKIIKDEDQEKFNFSQKKKLPIFIIVLKYMFTDKFLLVHQ